jgi:hypothetical protein
MSVSDQEAEYVRAKQPSWHGLPLDSKAGEPETVNPPITGRNSTWVHFSHMSTVKPDVTNLIFILHFKTARPLF